MALYSAAKGWQDTAPVGATRLLERYLFVKNHSGWTYRDYDEAASSDIWLEEELHRVELALIETAQKKADHGRS